MRNRLIIFINPQGVMVSVEVTGVVLFLEQSYQNEGRLTIFNGGGSFIAFEGDYKKALLLNMEIQSWLGGASFKDKIAFIVEDFTEQLS